MDTSSPQRLRPHPQQRFDSDGDRFMLPWAVHELASEDSGQAGHKQMTLFKHGPMTLALFVFEAGSQLKNHVIDGPVVIQTLAGQLRVCTNNTEHDLPTGAMLRLAPGIAHDVQAVTDSQMLLTVCLEGPGSHG